MHLHILGICGTFMGGIAVLARAAGHRVTGCDANVYPPMSLQLAEAGVDVIEGYSADQIALAPDVFVVGNAISRGNPLLEAILDQGLGFISGPQWLAENILKNKWVVAVAGTHGKTTTTSMLAAILEHAGARPGFLVGGVPLGFGVSARASESRFFVIEADEYDTAFSDKRSKFLHYRARTLVMNNLEFDHADIFADLAAIETQFHHLVRTLPASATVVANATEAAVRRVLQRGCWSRVEWFNDAREWSCESTGGGVARVLRGGKEVGDFRLGLPGEHNRSNALAAIAAAHHAGVAPGIACEALNGFAGIKRRLEIRGVVRGITVVDDFAHHPTAIAATLGALRERVGAARIIAVLEPRSNTMKMGVMKDRLAASLVAADIVYCHAGGLGWDPLPALAALGERARVCNSVDDIVAGVRAIAREGDHVLVMSNGGFGGIHQRLLDAFAGAAAPA